MPPPLNAKDFLKAAVQRLTTADTILNRLRITLDAQYIGGYAVECALKALILHRTPTSDQTKMLARLTKGSAMHRPEVLLGELREFGIALTPELAKRMRRFSWSTDLRYEIGRRDTGETKALLRTARMIYDWVEEQIT